MSSAARPSLFVRLTAMFVLAIALPFAGSAWFVMRNAGAWVEGEAQRRELALAAFSENLLLTTVERAEIKLATLARMVEGSELALTAEHSRLLEAQVEPPDVFLELQSFDNGPRVEVNSQVQQRAFVPDAERDRERALANISREAVQQPIATKLPWRSPGFERLREVSTLAVSAPNVASGSVQGVLVGYIDFAALRASLERAAGSDFRIVIRDRAGTLLVDAGAKTPDARSIERAVAETSWIIEVGESRERVTAPLSGLRRQILAWAGLGLLLALAAGSLLASRIARPIGRLEGAARRMASGDLAARSDVQGQDEIGRLGRAFDTMAAGFERLDAAKSAFVGNVSHELRTPLTSLRLSIENLLAGVRGPLSDEQRTTLERVERDLKRMSALVDDLLVLARLESGLESSKCEPHALRAIASEALEPWRGIAAARGVDLGLDGEGRALVDPALLRRALSNLIDNAVKFSPDGGQVELLIRGPCVTIQDQGPGIEGAHVFERFVQGEQHGAKAGGVGIGLSIVRQALRMMGAEVEARERADGRTGAVFVVRLREAQDR
ncbi:MAG: HAMP domain-containing sensor histidine kinase [Planctomycetota bacterium]